MNTKDTQEKAKEKKKEYIKRSGKLAFCTFLLSLPGVALLLFGYLAHLEPTSRYLFVCSGILIIMVMCSLSLIAENSKKRLVIYALILSVICVGIYLFIPEKLKEWLPEKNTGLGLGTQLTLALALLLFTATSLVLLKNTLGSNIWAMSNPSFFGICMALILIFCAYLKTKPEIWKSSELFDLFLTIAGVGIGTLLEKTHRDKAMAKPETK